MVSGFLPNRRGILGLKHLYVVCDQSENMSKISKSQLHENMNTSEIHGDLKEVWKQEKEREHRDSSSQRIYDLDRCLASMIQVIEDRRSAEKLQKEETDKEEKEKG